MATYSKLPSGTWRVQVRRKGRYIGETFIKRDDARRWATEAEGRIDRGEVPTPSRSAKLRTFGELIDLHIEDMKSVGNPQGLVSVTGPGRVKAEVSPASFDRLELILGRLAAAGETLEVELAADDKGACFKHQDQPIRFAVTESYRRHKHVLTDAEQAQQAAWEKKHEKVLRRGGWDTLALPNRPRFPEWDYAPTGQLSLEMEAPYLYGTSPRRTFRDAKIQRLEKMAGDIMVGVHVLAAAMQEDCLRREASERLRREAAERRERALRERHIHERRNAALDILLQEIGDLDRLRRVMAALQGELGNEPSGRVGEFMIFAEERLRNTEKGLQGAGLSSRFEAGRLFGDDDDHDFLPPRGS